VNWILNQDFVGKASSAGGNYTMDDVQEAIWRLLEDTPSWDDDIFGNEARVQAIIDSAESGGEGYQPDTEELLAVVLDPVEPETAQISIIPLRIPGGGEGCTPGFWKNNAEKWDAVAWVGYDPNDSFNTVFGVSIPPLSGNGKNVVTNPTLLDALNANGSGINLLARSAVAALLNASNPNVAYAMSGPQVIASVQAAIGAGPAPIQALGEQLDSYNNAGASIDQHGNPI
jgi:hypothetical protein